MSKIFLLGVGAQKSGTTWFYNSLCDTKEFCKGFRKEYHVFDGLTCCPIFRKRLKQRINQYIGNPYALNNNCKRQNLLMRALFYESTDQYFNYFHLLSNNNPDRKIFADITPSYSGLKSQTFSHIKSKLESIGFQVKVLFLMRDPVERAWSAARYLGDQRRKRQGEKIITEKNSKRMISLLKDKYASKQFELRGRYDITIKELSQVFSEDDILYGFYEELFTENFALKTQRFLELSEYQPDFNRYINVTRSEKVSLPQWLITDIHTHYKNVYNFVYHKFGNKVPTTWLK